MKAERPVVEPRPFESRVQHHNNYTASETGLYTSPQISEFG